MRPSISIARSSKATGSRISSAWEILTTRRWQRRVVNISHAEEILEPVALDDLAILIEGRIDRLLHLVEIHAEMPFALIADVVSQFAHAVADGLDLRRHVSLPERIGIIKNAGVLNVLAGVDGGSRG